MQLNRESYESCGLPRSLVTQNDSRDRISARNWNFAKFGSGVWRGSSNSQLYKESVITSDDVDLLRAIGPLDGFVGD